MGLANHDLPSPPSGKYPAKAHARRVAEYIRQNGGLDKGIIYLEAQKTHMVEVRISLSLCHLFTMPMPGGLCVVSDLSADHLTGR